MNEPVQYGCQLPEDKKPTSTNALLPDGVELVAPKPKPKSRAQDRVKELLRDRKALKEENEVLARQLEEALALNTHLSDRLRLYTAGGYGSNALVRPQPS